MSGNTYAVMLDADEGFDHRAAAAALAETFGKTPFDHMKPLKDSPGIFARDLPQHLADHLASALEQRGIRAFALAEEDMAILPPPVPVSQGVVEDEGFYFKAPQGNLMAPWGEILLMDCARVRYQIIRRSPPSTPWQQGLRNLTRDAFAGPIRFPLRGEASASGPPAPQASPAWMEVFDVVCYDPWVHFRIDMDKFHYARSGVPVHSTQHLSFTALVVVFRARAQNASLGPGIAHLLDGDPRTRSRADGLAAYENGLLWRLQLLWRRQG